MNRISADPRTMVDSLRCVHHTPKVGRCRFRISDLDARLCRRHAKLHNEAQLDADLALELVGKEYDFTSATQINGVLSRLLVFLAQDRISPRRGAVIAFVASLLLRTLPAINLQLHPKPDEDEPVEYVWDIPDPDTNSPTADTNYSATSPALPTRCPGIRPHDHAMAKLLDAVTKMTADIHSRPAPRKFAARVLPTGADAGNVVNSGCRGGVRGSPAHPWIVIRFYGLQGVTKRGYFSEPRIRTAKTPQLAHRAGRAADGHRRGRSGASLPGTHFDPGHQLPRVSLPVKALRPEKHVG